MKRVKKLRQAFGTVDEGPFVAFPAKFSNVQVSRVVFGEARGCAVCFPHGPETNNATLAKQQRTWKQFRRNQWKS
ncbi:phosphate ABC transporter substrate-binding protein [Hymenobacter aquaticus]|uniref:Phosphate ABC transporter substrate-binding protein n=1 Tax=Hymenobacter aquaticus TaxID=1867101 RepID=A0A4Z0Q4T4_9BACT|nr:phosphate ABC transporter substrate-binding protein [Hymenobacter aquaticus]TGE25037.1 phosphate ABC transporter substrate-binding protein [Hymenobacter aquaticus]